MRPSSKIIINVVAQYIRTIINTVLALFSTRLILEILGVEDYGLYILIAGVISMLSFATNALSITTQRFLSFHQGKSHLQQQRDFFASSLCIHIIVGLLLVIILFSLIPVLFNGFLNIPSKSINVAAIIYTIVVSILITSFIISPFRAVLISHENIVFISIVEIADGVLKVIAALLLFGLPINKLVGYALLLLGIQLINTFTISAYCFIKYKECKQLSIKSVKWSNIKQLLSFAGWTIYSIGCVIGRTQGVAIILNKFFGTAVNAAYGIGFQVSGYVAFISESVLNAMRPQIIRSEGQNERKHMLWLSEVASKFSTVLLCCIAIPCIVELPNLLSLWLHDVPEYTTLFCRMVLCASLFDTFTSGLVVANHAIGDIKKYSLTINTIKIITVPTTLIFVAYDAPIIVVATLYVFFEALCAFLRVYYLHYSGGLCVRSFIKNNFIRLIPPIIILSISVVIASRYFTSSWRLIPIFLISNILFIIGVFFIGLNNKERQIVKKIIKNK